MLTRWPVVALCVLLAHAALLGLLGLGLQQARPYVDSLVAVQWLPAPLALAALPHLAQATQGAALSEPAARPAAPQAAEVSARSHSPAPALEPQRAQQAQPVRQPETTALPPSAGYSEPGTADSGPASAAPGTHSAAGQTASYSGGPPLGEATASSNPGSAPVLVPPSAARHLHNPAPPYPALSRRLGEQGRVLLRVRIEPDGRASQVLLEQSSGYARLDQAALKTVPHWRFVPGTRNGVALAMWFQIPVQFVLE